MIPPGRCLILSAHDRLIDRRIIAQANLLSSLGWQVTLASVPAQGRELLSKNIRLLMLETDRASALTPRARIGRLVRRLPEPLKAPLRAVRWAAGRTPMETFRRRFAPILPREPFDIIHCHDLQTLPIGIQYRHSHAPAARIIYDSHELFPYQYPAGRVRQYWLSVETKSIPEAQAVITVNESIAEKMAEAYHIPKPAVLYNSCHYSVSPISPEAFHAHFNLPITPPDRTPFTIIFQGAFSREKNVLALTRAFALLGPAFRLLLLGGGGIEKQVRRAAQSCPNNVHFGAWVDADRLLAFVARADAGIIPYLGSRIPNNFFCTPNKLFEYLQAGIPICAAELPELQRIVAGEHIGKIYNLQTPEQIAAALSDFSPRCRAHEFMAHSFATAREKFSWDRQAQCLLNVYHQLGAP